MRRTIILGALFLFVIDSKGNAQSDTYNSPWKDTSVALILDPYHGNPIIWNEVIKDKQVVAIIHKATQGLTLKDDSFEIRRTEALKRGFKWGAYHMGGPGLAKKQADAFLKFAHPDSDELMALDLEDIHSSKWMSLDSARVFILRIKELTGRYPVMYMTSRDTREVSRKLGKDTVFENCKLWIAAPENSIHGFPTVTWKTYLFWQFQSETNCLRNNLKDCPHYVVGTQYDMDVNVYNGTITELKGKWPFDK